MRRLLIAAVAALALGLGACTPGEGARPQADLVVVGPFLGVDADAFASSLRMFERESGLSVTYIGMASFVQDLEASLRDGLIPDVALVPQPGLVRELAGRGQIVPLPESVVATVEANYDEDRRLVGMVDGVHFGAWYRGDVKSLVWYSPRLFAEHGWAVPGTWQELLDLSQTIAGSGIAPWCLTMGDLDSTGWVGTDWIEDLMLRSAGPEVYDRWMRGEVPFESPEVREAFLQFGEVLAPGMVLGGTQRILSVLYREAAGPLFADPPGCALFRFGTAARSFFPGGTAIGANGDIDFFPLPPFEAGEQPQLVVGGEVAVAFNERPEVAQLLDYLASPRSGEEWARRGGYLPPHNTFDVSALTSEFERRIALLVATAGVVRFDASDTMPVEVGSEAFRAAIVRFVQGGDLDAILCGVDRAWESYRQAQGTSFEMPAECRSP